MSHPRRELGTPGHFICAERCLFRRHTHVGPWCVSTVGDYRVSFDHGKPTEIGVDRLYETMVFRSDPEHHHDGDDLDFAPANDEEMAERNHEEMVAKWAELNLDEVQP